ncbi:hypothetical protein PISMIDRAFT_265730 [Pisolithus microcarpus 441]|uniref:Uncharacterized protein n=1 Tax=Pisolithus microcarpus 441 TaxID=765257 RepID=A0A0C9YIH4_9AGAM|nr:hypothetical protein PISMIDRAFT_265730 [Pisolithus microcarpus 441]
MDHKSGMKISLVITIHMHSRVRRPGSNPGQATCWYRSTPGGPLGADSNHRTNAILYPPCFS